MFKDVTQMENVMSESIGFDPKKSKVKEGMVMLGSFGNANAKEDEKKKFELPVFELPSIELKV